MAVGSTQAPRAPGAEQPGGAPGAEQPGRAPGAEILLEKGSLTLVLPEQLTLAAAPARSSAAARQAQAARPANRYRITLRAHDLANPLTAEATGAADATTLEVANVPPGQNRLIVLQALNDDGQDIPGARWHAVASLLSTRNRAVLSPASDAVGRVWARWLDQGKTAFAGAQDPAAVARKLEAIRAGSDRPSLYHVDAARFADAAAAAGSLEVGTAGFDIAPAILDLTLTGAPANVPADIWVSDPASPLQSGVSRIVSLSEGRYRIDPILPGTWTVNASVPGMGVASKAVTLAAGSTLATTLSFAGWQAGPALPAAIGNPGAATDGRKIYLVGGVTPQLRHKDGVTIPGAATDSCWVLDTGAASPAWQTLPAIGSAREGAAATIVQNRLYAVGGASGGAEFSDAWVLDLANPSSWVQIISPQALAGCANGVCPDPGLPILGFEDGGQVAVLWGVFNDQANPPFSRGHSHRYDVGGNLWTKDPSDIPAIRTPRQRAAAGVFGNLVVVAGGNREAVREGAASRGSAIPALATVEVFDKTSRKWAAWPDLLTPRSEAAGAGASGSFFVAGGVDVQDHALDVVERYDLARRAWFPAPPLLEPRSAFPLVAASGKLWAIGGSPSRELNRNELDDKGAAITLKSVETLDLGGLP